MNKRITSIKFRRRREAVTNYKKRLEMVKSGLDRIVLRKTNTRILAQVARYSPKGDVVLVQADSNELSTYKWPGRANRPTAYLTGLLLAKKYKDAKSREHILDTGLASPVKNSIPFVFEKGCIDGGMKVRSGVKMDEKTYNASDSKFASELKSKSPDKYKKQYSAYIKEGVDPESMQKLFNEVKEKIIKG